MSARELPFTVTQIQELIKICPTPFYVYDETGIRDTARGLNKVFDWVEPQHETGYINYFAAKATPNPYILEIMKQEGMGVDASSGPELELAAAIGLQQPYIMFTSNNTPPEEYKEAYQAGAIINLDDIRQISAVKRALDRNFPKTISFRYNPGNKKASGVNSIIGTPEDSKFGVPDNQLEAAYLNAKQLGVQHFGMHTMVASNELAARQHVATATILFEKVVELSRKLAITFEFVNLGGGLGIPYRPEESPIDYKVLRSGMQQAYKKLIIDSGLPPLRIATENGRHITGPHGYLVSRVRSLKETFHRYVGLDASMSDLMRPAMYDSYHEITVMGREAESKRFQRVVGSLCENNDHFTGSITKERELPVMYEGDIVVIHDAGAHGHAMGFNYNGKLRSPEFLLRPDGGFREIRKAETRADLFATLDYPGL